MRDVMDVLASARTIMEEAQKVRELDWKLKHLQSVVDWAVKQQPVGEGDRARLTKAPKTDNGWKAYREVLVEGCEGTVGEVDYNDLYDYWGAYFTPDEQWILGPSGERIDISKQRLGCFFIPMRLLERIGD